jgi:hypothetical protein
MKVIDALILLEFAPKQACAVSSMAGTVFSLTKDVIAGSSGRKMLFTL